ncbi:MAG: hypothetical protein JXA77_04470 [Bacteroidales bacterium]|nr:hypothetical protein [Bacteroidales bacterium]MBN2819809.1 hypothetical protein [Bacteroidales bacterium]
MKQYSHLLDENFIRSNFHKIFLLFFLLITPLFINNALAQKSLLSISFSNIKIADEYYWFEDNIINSEIGYNYNIYNHLRIGGYTGIGIYEEWYGLKSDNSIELTYNFKHPISLHYGVNINIFILPLFFKTNIPRFDFYLSGKMGFISLLTSPGENLIPQRGNYFDYSVMLGSTIYLSKKIGLNTEIGYKNFEYHKGFNALYGLRFRF